MLGGRTRTERVDRTWHPPKLFLRGTASVSVVRLQVMGARNPYSSGEFSGKAFTPSFPLLPNCHQGSDASTVLLNKCGQVTWSPTSQILWRKLIVELQAQMHFEIEKAGTTPLVQWERHFSEKWKMLKRNQHIAQPHLEAQGLLIWSE